MSTIKPIGFTFNFFGQAYTDFYISSNGLITFSPNMPATPVYGEAIPNTTDPDNFIALAWNDLNPQNAGSSISYFNTGVAPNRKLIVKYSTSHYGGTIYPFVVQAILNEGSDIIEIHTTTISDASAFDPATKLLYTSNGEGTVTVIKQESANKYSVVETIKTQPGAKTMAYDAKLRRLYLSAAEYGPVPAAAAPGQKRPRAAVLPGTFKVLVLQNSN